MDEFTQPTKQLYDDRSIEIVSEMVGLIEEMNDRLLVIREEAAAAEATVSAAIQSQLQTLKVELFEANKVPEDEYDCWMIDSRYVDDHGIAYLALNTELYKEQILLDRRLKAPVDN